MSQKEQRLLALFVVPIVSLRGLAMEYDEHPLGDAELARALNWIAQHGHLLEYDCPDRTVPRLLRVLEARHLVSTAAGRKRLTDAGVSFLASQIRTSEFPTVSSFA
jgi:hypothetical protein